MGQNIDELGTENILVSRNRRDQDYDGTFPTVMFSMVKLIFYKQHVYDVVWCMQQQLNKPKI